jgi:hypothetical protein
MMMREIQGLMKSINMACDTYEGQARLGQQGTSIAEAQTSRWKVDIEDRRK